MEQNLTLVIGVIGTLITTVLSIIVSNHKLKTQLITDVTTPITEMKKEVTSLKADVSGLDKKVNNIYADMKTNDKLTGDALLSLLRHRLTESGHKYIKLGYIVEDELEAFTNEYTSYTELGGNHYVTALYNKVMELPCRSLEEQERRSHKKKSNEQKVSENAETAVA